MHRMMDTSQRFHHQTIQIKKEKNRDAPSGDKPRWTGVDRSELVGRNIGRRTGFISPYLTDIQLMFSSFSCVIDFRFCFVLYFI